MSKKQIVIFVSVVFILATGFLSVRGQEQKVELNNKKITIKMVNKPLFDVFMRLIYDYDVAIGFEQSILDSESEDYHFETNIPYDNPITQTSDGVPIINFGGRPIIKNHLITVNYKDAKLDEVMNDIVKQMQNYDWKINDNVVNIFPIRGRDPKLVKLLDLSIREFGVGKDTEVGAIQSLIYFYLPEFKTFLKENNLETYSVRHTPWYLERPLPVGMKFSDITFKELLNKITKSKRGGWILRRGMDNDSQGEKFIEILI